MNSSFRGKLDYRSDREVDDERDKQQVWRKHRK